MPHKPRLCDGLEPLAKLPALEHNSQVALDNCPTEDRISQLLDTNVFPNMDLYSYLAGRVTRNFVHRTQLRPPVYEHQVGKLSLLGNMLV